MQLDTKRGVQMFHDESWQHIYFGVKGQGHESQNIVGVGRCTLVSVGLF